VPVSTAKLSLINLRKEVEGYIREARQLISNLRSPRLAQSGLAAALRDAGAHAASAASLGFTFQVTGDTRACAPQVEEHLLRVGQEAMTNAIRHARAQLVHVGLDYGKSDVVLRVVDDGCGFDPARAAAADDHYGLKSMRERIDVLRGSLMIGSRPGGGTEIVASVPYGD
jgi:signal transduction histidine kinase